MNRGVAKTAIFLADADRRAFVAELGAAFIDDKVELHAFCLMGNHYHLLVRSLDGRLSPAMQRLSSRYTHQFNQRHRRDGPLFRGRYLSVGIADDAHLLQALRYIHHNPCRDGRWAPEEWPWSSAAAYLANSIGAAERSQSHGSDHLQEPCGHLSLVTSELLAMFGPPASTTYRAFMQAGIDETSMAFYRDLQTGNEPWV